MQVTVADRRPQRVGGLQGMASLDSLLAHGAAADRNIEASPNGLADDLLLKLGLGPLHLECSTTLGVRTLGGKRNGDHLVHLLRYGFAAMLSVGLTGLASRTLGVRLASAAGERRRLTLLGGQALF